MVKSLILCSRNNARPKKNRKIMKTKMRKNWMRSQKMMIKRRRRIKRMVMRRSVEGGGGAGEGEETEAIM